MKAEYIAEIVKIVEDVKSGKIRRGIDIVNCVMDPKYGQKYIVPIPEDYINIFNQFNNVNDQQYNYLMDDIFHDVVVKNLDLREFIDVPDERRFDVCMGAASWLSPTDIKYYIDHPYNLRSKWVTDLDHIAKQLYGEQERKNSKGFVEWIHFVLSPETSLKVIVDHADRLKPWQAKHISDIVTTHPIVAPLKLHSILNQ